MKISNLLKLFNSSNKKNPRINKAVIQLRETKYATKAYTFWNNQNIQTLAKKKGWIYQMLM